MAAPSPEAFGAVTASLPSSFDRVVLASQTLLFMHERRASQSSEPRLVVVLIDSKLLLSEEPNSSNFGQRGLSAVALRTTSPTKSMAAAAVSGYGSRMDSDDDYPPLRIFGGMADSADVTRFYIPYEVSGTSGMIIGRLMGDDSVALTAEGPLGRGWSRDVRQIFP